MLVYPEHQENGAYVLERGLERHGERYGERYGELTRSKIDRIEMRYKVDAARTSGVPSADEFRNRCSAAGQAMQPRP